MLASSMRAARLGICQCHCLSLLLLLHLFSSRATGQATDQRSHLRRLFESLDQDHDGQLRKQELRQYIGGLAPEYSDSRSKLDQAVKGAIDRLDSADIGLGVSRIELEQHLHTLLPGVKVADWVAHGLGLPQYAEAFRTNSITALDFPMLVNDGGKLLQTELKVTSPLHRQQLLRAMQRQIFGLGSPPGPAHSLICTPSPTSTVSTPQHTPHSAAAPAQQIRTPTGGSAEAGGPWLASTAHTGSSTASGHAAGPTAAAATAPTTAAEAGLAVVCSWKPPVQPGQPGMHKYVLQRLDHTVASAAWQTVAELQDSLSVRYKDGSLSPEVYQYRLTAWNVYGRSPYILSASVTLPGIHAATAAAAAAAEDPAAVLRGHFQASTAGLATAMQFLGTACPAAEQPSSNAHTDTAYAGGMSAGLPHPQAGVCSGAALPVGFVQYQHKVMQQQQQAGHDGACTTDTSLDPANESQQGCSNLEPAAFSHLSQPSDMQGLGHVQGYGSSQNLGVSCHSSPSSSLVWLVGSDPSQQQWQQQTPVTAAGREAQHSLAASVKAQAANARAAGGPGHRIPAHAHGNAALAAAAAAAAAGNAAGAVSSNSSHKPAVAAQLVAVLSSAWHSSIGGWVKAVLNTLTAFALVVLPICVRLLPVPMLRRAAQLLAMLLQLLPGSVRRRLLLHPQQQQQQQQQQPSLSSRGSDSGLGSGATYGGLTSSSSRGRLAPSGASSGALSAAGATQPTVLPAAEGAAAATPAAAGGSPERAGPPIGADEPKSSSMSLVTAAASFLSGLKSGRSSPVKVLSTKRPPISEPTQQQQQQQQLAAELGTLPHAWQQQQCSQDSAAAEAAGTDREAHSPAASVSGVRRRFMPRSISDFDLVRQAQNAPSSPARAFQSARALNAHAAASPSSPGILAAAAAGGLSPAAAAGMRFASSGGFRPSDITDSSGSGQRFSQPVLDGSSSSWVPGAAAAAAAAAAEGVSSSGIWPGHVDVHPAGILPGSAPLFGQVPAGDAFHRAAEGLNVGDVQQEVERELQYALYCTQGRTVPDNKQCCFPGCEQQFGLRHWKATLQRHYCGRCQQAFCLQHTSYSPHGPSGTCGVQSRCLCIDCFYEYTPEYQAFLASRNTLVSKRSKSSPSEGLSTSLGPQAGFTEGDMRQGGSGSSSRPGGLLSRLVPSLSSSKLQEVGIRSIGRRQQQSQEGAEAEGTLLVAAGVGQQGEQGQQEQQQGQQEQQQGQHAQQDPACQHAHADTGAPAVELGDALQDTTRTELPPRLPQQEQQQPQRSPAFSQGLKSRMLWERGLTKALGVVRFRHAGEGHAADQARAAGLQQPATATVPP